MKGGGNMNTLRKDDGQVTVFYALAREAKIKDLEMTCVADLAVGEHCVYVSKFTNGMYAVISARAGWHVKGLMRVMTDVTAFVWCGHETNADDAVTCSDRVFINNTRAVYRCPDDIRARALAAIVSENGDFDRAEELYSAR